MSSVVIKIRKTERPVIVTQSGAPCALVNLTGYRRGLALLPGSPVAIFGTRRRARAAIARTHRIAARLRGSVIDEWPKLRPLFNGQPLKIEPASVTIS